MLAAARWGPSLEIALWLSLLLPGGPGWRCRFRTWLRTGLALCLATGLVLALRRLAPRPRPFVAGDARALLAREPGPSLPSRHTASAVAMALVVHSAAPRRGRLMAAAAALLGLSRVYCGLHYPSDVLAGAALGLAAAWLSGPVRWLGGSGRPG